MTLSSTPEYLTAKPATTSEGLASAQSLLRLRKQLELGLPITQRPYEALAEKTGLAVAEVMTAVSQWQAQGLIKRLGLVVRHRTLGYTANAMVVWDIPDDQVGNLGRAMARAPAVTLCYQRPRRPPAWPYNLFCMIHGTDRNRVLSQLATLKADHSLEHTPHAILFSTKAYRQRGGSYVSSD